MVLRAGFIAVAMKLQEAADIVHSDVRARLADAINDAYRGTGSWANYIDHTGDGESGDVIYACNGDTFSCPYAISEVDGKAVTSIDKENSKDVVPRTTYQEEAEDADHYTAMDEAFKRDGLYADLPLYERFISKAERDKASADDFAGKGKSFPILKPEDVQAAVHAMGRAGDKNVGMNALKSRIIAIAKRKGWTSELPKSWQNKGAAAESASVEATGMRLVESAACLETIALREARADYEIKLIAPGKGSSAFYPAEVLKRDGPQVFKAGTHVYVNHPTFAEESARPEGDVKNLAGVLTTNAQYHDSHAKGPGLYGRMKVFADHGQMVEEKAAHVGMSIRANGMAATESGKTKMQDGVPVLAKLTSAESVDVVTRAGAGGMILTEAARTAANPEGDEMSEDEKKQLREAVRIVTEDRARRLAESTLRDVTLMEAGKTRVVDTCLRHMPMKDGALDETAFVESVKDEAKREGKYLAELMGTGVRGMGAAPVQLSEADEEKQRKAEQRLLESSASVFADIIGDPKAAMFAAKGRAA